LKRLEDAASSRAQSELIDELEHAQAPNAGEVATVPRRDAEAVRQRRRRDPEIVRTDHLSALAEVGPRLCVDPGDRLGDR